MYRRGFLFGSFAGVISLLTHKINGSQIVIPPIPTLESLQSECGGVFSFNVSYSSQGTWDALVFRHARDGDAFSDMRAQLFYENKSWVAVDKFYRTESGKIGYEKQIEWPGWLKKF